MVVRVVMSPLPPWEILTLIMILFLLGVSSRRGGSLGLGFKNKDWFKDDQLWEVGSGILHQILAVAILDPAGIHSKPSWLPQHP